MNQLSITLSQAQQQRLLKFLDRVQLTGAEVPAFAQIRNLILAARPAVNVQAEAQP
jgi:hypothetical protein